VNASPGRWRGKLRAAALLLLVPAVGLALHALHLPVKAAMAQWLLMRAWEQAQRSDVRPRPWPWADAWPVARLSLAGVHHVVLAGTEGSALPFAPGWMTASAAPGTAGTSVIAAHRDTHFRGLGTLAAGDRIGVTLADGRQRDYRVTGAQIHDARGPGLLLADDGVPRLALVTCYPLDGLDPGSPWRYVVWAEAPPAPAPVDRSATGRAADPL
jgi:sortase A